MGKGGLDDGKRDEYRYHEVVSELVYSLLTVN